MSGTFLHRRIYEKVPDTFLLIWFAGTLFVAAFLLFSVQPMIAKMILPLLGGTPAVWNTCMVFFQTTLLAGYIYGHAITRSLSARQQAVLHVGILVLAALTLSGLTLPMELVQSSQAPQSSGAGLNILDRLGAGTVLGQISGTGNPIPRLLLLLTVSVGLPTFVVSTSAPLLQQWFARSGHPASGDPYFLYSASNFGSMMALLAYPTLIEPNLRLITQGKAWSAGYVLLAILVAGCAILTRRAATGVPETNTSEETLSGAVLTIGRRLRWLALAFVPSVWVLGVTTFLGTDIAAIPLLWIVPLALYLLTFIIAFARTPLVPHGIVVRALPLVMLAQTFIIAIVWMRPLWLLIFLHLFGFFVAALFCHGELAKDRPPARYLTEFYLWLSIGGVLGGVFNALLAPLLFSSIVEYPLALLLVCLLLPRPDRRAGHSCPAKNGGQECEAAQPPHQSKPLLNWGDLWFPLFLGLFLFGVALEFKSQDRHLLWLNVTIRFGLPAAICYMFVGRPIRFGLGVGAILLAGSLNVHTTGAMVHVERSFFGVLRVFDKPDKNDRWTKYRILTHGNTIHGAETLDDDPERRRQPLTYYFRDGPIGQIFTAAAERDHRRDAGDTSAKTRVAVLGLGAGTLTSYGEPGQEWTIYEIDPAIVRVAHDYFHYLGDYEFRGGRVQIVLGDARLSLARAPRQSFGLIFADAFSSDSLPVHLITREALQLYLDKLADGGILVVNIANRYLDLEPVLADLTRDAGLVARVQMVDAAAIGKDYEKHTKTPCHWAVLARRESDLGKLAGDPRWQELRTRPGTSAGRPPWTDDYSNLLGAFRWDN